TRMERHQLESLENYTLVLGYSEFVYTYISNLQRQGKICVIVERSQQESEALRKEGFIVIDQNADDEALIKSFNLSRCERILIASEDDGYNILIAATLSQALQSDEIRSKVSIIVNRYRDIKKFSIFGFQIIDISSVVSAFLSKN
ncbi:MAG: NAD-binding protein, partial [Thermoplasmataceae archaeon]